MAIVIMHSGLPLDTDDLAMAEFLAAGEDSHRRLQGVRIKMKHDELVLTMKNGNFHAIKGQNARDDYEKIEATGFPVMRRPPKT